MTDKPVHLLISTFTDEDSAGEALEVLKTAQKNELLQIHDAAIIRREDNNHLHIKETGDMGLGKGAAIGGAIGGAIGLLAGPAGVIALGATGAWIGGIAAASTDSGIPDGELQQIATFVTPGTSAIVVLVEDQWVDDVNQQLVASGGTVLTTGVKGSIAEKVAEEKEDRENSDPEAA